MAKRLHNICLRGPAGKGWTLPAAVLVTLFLMANPGALAEETLATVRGTVRAPTGVSISETTVVAKNSETEQRREVSSGAEGQFVIQQLPPGTYQVQASRAGFVSRMQKKVELRAGQVVQLAFLLEAVSGTQGREAQDDDDQNDQDDQNAGELETSSAAVSNWIDESQLVGLPLNGRSYSQLATLQAGVSDTSGASGARGVGGGGLTVAGGRSTSNTFLLDGTNIMNADNRVPRSAAGVQLGSDAVLQVQVFSSNYGAEYGRGSGGVMNSITRSGTPELHGTFFEFLRNSKLDAKNFFDPDGEPIPPFKRNQFGFMLTGPVWKDRTFFMASFEGLRDRLTETDTSFFPDELARNGIITDKNGAVLEEIEVNPSVIPYLALYPIPNAGSVGGGKGIHKAPRFLPTNEIFFTVRIDHKISDQDSLFGRYTFDDATSVTSGGPTFLFLRRND
ncbi:MAG: carboxypeptidase regulatory-like domain-containing protein, partial [Acidobacteria bacterium]|nr:carboxypeptidase regulatory-like domain-containing protein [Acidobacteriota bacterium]